ncbi:hypothetical protein [Corynebacterium lubricantis]|uniref:hypothetical protein n=1 Tax=Corynebacterium lubricantis TaxID=541095 RepID=UPI00037707BA|nr:hypothetical protein [Corynebacterium lubricantis]
MNNDVEQLFRIRYARTFRKDEDAFTAPIDELAERAKKHFSEMEQLHQQIQKLNEMTRSTTGRPLN